LLSTSRSELVYEIEVLGELYRFTWLGQAETVVARVKAFAFADAKHLLLVHGDDGWQLPGGGLENGERPMEGLKRELWEEAAASIVKAVRLGAFQIDGLTCERHEVHDFYWCRVTLEDSWVPTHDISERLLVDVDRFLETLPWGRTDPKANFLLEHALAIEVTQ
jgi:8-oxo-dGTP pyrophosphatase MutT (NUDIX family)